MRSVNKVIVIGHLTNDPELKETSKGHSMALFSIATNRDWTNQDGEKQEFTDYHRVVAWRQLGEVCGKYLTKGSSVYLEGRLANRKYKDKEEKDRYITEIVAEKINFITIKKVKDASEVNLVDVSDKE